MFSLALLAIAAYAATNIDNLFVLLAFLAEAGGRRRRRVIAGQYAGSLILIAGSLLLAALLTRLPAGYIGLLGLLPIGVGLSKAWERFGPGNAQHKQTARDGACVGAGTHASAEAVETPEPIDAAEAANMASAHSTGRAPSGSSAWTVASVAIANGSDNLAVYVPLYASHSPGEGAFISLVFIVMIGLWCAAAVWLVEHPLLGAPIRRYGTALLPLILLTIGASVIAQNDTLRIVFGI
ncbi:putative permease, cadmium resistance protein [Paraburkholderia ribeironis]|uniref:Putative permease, cadmium resistance protein n=1 Tax=Paraburkholderia ribeironis TaxID=1247936 RepID=A0A1N7SGU7_9BURK|nr:cadmium resistance transporter [Paraburkholderia ribeironis]SIT46638.1 putative permease, cadmium resistance protein [Paraburkholderia ribeironis]